MNSDHPLEVEYPRDGVWKVYIQFLFPLNNFLPSSAPAQTPAKQGWESLNICKIFNHRPPIPPTTQESKTCPCFVHNLFKKISWLVLYLFCNSLYLRFSSFFISWTLFWRWECYKCWSSWPWWPHWLFISSAMMMLAIELLFTLYEVEFFWHGRLALKLVGVRVDWHHH